MTHSPTTWLFITLEPGVHIVMDLEIRDDSDDGTTVLSESPLFNDNGQEMEEAMQ